MKARHIIEVIDDDGNFVNTITYTEEINDIKKFNKELLKRFSETKQAISVKETTYYPESTVKDTLCDYKVLNTSKMFREFKEKYHYPKMSIYSYRRVYIADMFKFFAKKLHKSFIEVAADLLDSEYMGRRNTLLDVFLAETNLDREEALLILDEKFYILNSIKLYDLDTRTKKLYEDALLLVE